MMIYYLYIHSYVYIISYNIQYSCASYFLTTELTGTLPSNELLFLKVKVTLRLMVSQCLDVEPTLELVTRYYFLSECCCLKIAVLSLWDVLSCDGMGLQFAVQSLNGPSRSEPITIFYWLLFLKVKLLYD
jgi:hypothetical protein